MTPVVPVSPQYPAIVFTKAQLALSTIVGVALYSSLTRWIYSYFPSYAKKTRAYSFLSRTTTQGFEFKKLSDILFYTTVKTEHKPGLVMSIPCALIWGVWETLILIHRTILKTYKNVFLPSSTLKCCKK